MPEDIRVESLNDDQMRDLNRLKGWLYKKRTDIRLDRDRAERQQKKEEEAARREAAQPDTKSDLTLNQTRLYAI